MSDSIIDLTSGDELDPEENMEEIHNIPNSEGKRKTEDLQETSKKRRIAPTYIGCLEQQLQKSESADSVSPNEENHDIVFGEFVETCLDLDRSSNMEKIVEKKLKKYYSLLVPEYRRSEQFITFLERKKAEMQRSSSQRFMHLKEVVDELSTHRCSKKESSKSRASDYFVRELCKAMELILRKIKKLEEKEVSWDDEDDSSYLQLQRYRERLIKIHKKVQELEGNSSGFHRKISFSGTQFPKVNRAIEKFMNTKQEFPDYHDIYDLLKISYESENIDISAQNLRSEAKTVFQTVGEKLQKMRKLECWESVRWFLKEEEEDPADVNEEMKNVLNDNKKKFQEQIDEVINSYAEKSTKPQFASEDSNSCENAVKKEEETLEDDGEEEVKENKEENGGDVEDEDLEEEEEEEGRDDEENENVPESVDDILNEIGKEEMDDDIAETSENIFQYCGPVSPPTPFGGSSNSDAVSHESNSVMDCTLSESSEEETNGNLETIYDDDTVDLSIPSCSKWDNLEEQVKALRSFSPNEERDYETKTKVIAKEPRQNNESKMLIKVRPLSSLQGQEPRNPPEEILLD